MIRLDGLIPSKKNSRVNTRSGRSFPSRKYMAWHKDAMKQLYNQVIPLKPIEKAKVRLHLWFGTLHRADMTNKAESVMDLLVDAGILLDDNWQVVNRLPLTARYRQGRPGALIRVVPRG